MLYHWARTARAAHRLLEGDKNGSSSSGESVLPSVYPLDAIIQSVETITRFIKDDHHPTQSNSRGGGEFGLTSAIVLREWLQVRIASAAYQQYSTSITSRSRLRTFWV